MLGLARGFRCGREDEGEGEREREFVLDCVVAAFDAGLGFGVAV